MTKHIETYWTTVLIQNSKRFFCWNNQLFIKAIITTAVLMLSNYSFSQTISGKLPKHKDQKISLYGYNGFEAVKLSSDLLNEAGDFSLSYKNYSGMGYIETEDNSLFILILNEQHIDIKGSHLKETSNVSFNNSLENEIFNKYAVEHKQREDALAGWKFLLPKYQNTPLFKQNKNITNTIQEEIERIEQQDLDFLNNIPSNTYASWYLPLRKLIDDIPLSAQRYTQRIPKNISDFRNINFNDEKMIHSGILKDLIESHYWLIENSGTSTDSMYVQMNKSTNILINNIIENNLLLNKVAGFLFHLLEKRSLYTASEHLALKLLNQKNCKINDGIEKQMEAYRVMKIGNIAPEINFEGKKLMMGSEIKQELSISDLSSDYTLVIFGASWCPECAIEIPKVKAHYVKWKLKGLETVFTSL